MYYSTKQAGELLKIRPDKLQKAVWIGQIDTPEKSPQGAFLWTIRDIEKAAVALHVFNRLKLIQAISRQAQRVEGWK